MMNDPLNPKPDNTAAPNTPHYADSPEGATDAPAIDTDALIDAPTEPKEDVSDPPAASGSPSSPAHDPPGSGASAAFSVWKIVRPILSVLSAAVFAVAMYVEISAAVASFVPDGIVSIAAQLPFGGDFTSSAPSSDGAGGAPSDVPGTYAAPSETSALDADAPVTDADTVADDPPAPPETGGGDGDDGGGDVVRYPIVARDMSTGVPRGLTCSNQTEYELDLDYFADAEYVQPPLADLIASFPPDTENPVVLIIHTHGTESYAPEGADSYSATDNGRSTDITKNVVAVGEVMAQYFEAHGIKTIHCTEMFDEESYMAAYENSSAAVREYLAIYPSIRYIFDVHRDSVISDDLTKYKAVTDVDGVPTAQFMCVVGTNFKGAAHPHWRDNLTLAAHLQVRLWNRSNTLPRRLSIRGASFYQQYAPGSLLLEIGSCGNTLSEAKACAELVAEELTEIILNGE